MYEVNYFRVVSLRIQDRIAFSGPISRSADRLVVWDLIPWRGWDRVDAAAAV